MTVEQLATVVFDPLDESADSPKSSTKKGSSRGDNSKEGTPKKEVTFLANGARADSLYGAFERFEDDDDDEDVNGFIISATSTTDTIPPATVPTANTTTTTTTAPTPAAAIEPPTKTPSKSAASNAPILPTTPASTSGPPIIDTPGPDYEADFDGSDDDLIIDEEEGTDSRK